MKALVFVVSLIASIGGGASAFAQSPSQQAASPAAPATGTTTEQPHEKTKAERREARKRLHAVQRRRIK